MSEKMMREALEQIAAIADKYAGEYPTQVGSIAHEALAQPEPVELTDEEIVTVPKEDWDAMVRLAIASNDLDHHAEEYDFDDGLGRGASQTFWDEFSSALMDALEVIAAHEAKKNGGGV